MLNIIKPRKWFLLAPLVIILVGIICFIINGGFVEDIDFAGGTTMYIDMGQDYEVSDVQKAVQETLPNLVNPTVQRSDGNQVVIKTTPLSTDERDTLTGALIERFGLTEESFLQTDNVDATMGAELKRQALMATLIAGVCMLIYITIRFEWRSGLAAVLALVHDVLIMLSVYAIFRIPINTSFIAAILTIIGYSINATIVVFDRIRENRKKNRRANFDDTVNTSVNQTLTRSINTTVTTLLTISMVYILGVTAIRDFAFPIIVGLIAGAYSSIFLSGSFWAFFYDASQKRKQKKKLKTA